MITALKDYINKYLLLIIIIIVCAIIFMGQDDPYDGDLNFNLNPSVIITGTKRIIAIPMQLINKFKPSESFTVFGRSEGMVTRDQLDEEARYSDPDELSNINNAFDLTYGKGADAALLKTTQLNFVKNNKFNQNFLNMKQNTHKVLPEPRHANLSGFKGTVPTMSDNTIFAKNVEKGNTARFKID